MTVLRVCYKQGVPFDEAHYHEKHIPLAGPIMAALGVTETEVVKVSGSVSRLHRALPVRLHRVFRFAGCLAAVRASLPTWVGSWPTCRITSRERPTCWSEKRSARSFPGVVRTFRSAVGRPKGLHYRERSALPQGLDRIQSH